MEHNRNTRVVKKKSKIAFVLITKELYSPFVLSFNFAQIIFVTHVLKSFFYIILFYGTLHYKNHTSTHAAPVCNRAATGAREQCPA